MNVQYKHWRWSGTIHPTHLASKLQVKCTLYRHTGTRCREGREMVRWTKCSASMSYPTDLCRAVTFSYPGTGLEAPVVEDALNSRWRRTVPGMVQWVSGCCIIPSHPSSPLFAAFHPDNPWPRHLSISVSLTETSVTLKVTTCSSGTASYPCRGLSLVSFAVDWRSSRRSQEWLTPQRREARCTPKITTSLSVRCLHS